MKRVFAVLAIGLVLFFYIFPITIVAQEVTARECCKLGRDIKMEGKTYDEDLIVGSRTLTSTECRFGAVSTQCTDTDNNGTIDQTSECYNTDKWGMICLFNTIYRITDWIFYILMTFVGVMVVLGAFYIVTAGGAPDRVGQGKNYILYAVIGMIVAFFAKAIPSIVETVVGM